MSRAKYKIFYGFFRTVSAAADLEAKITFSHSGLVIKIVWSPFYDLTSVQIMINFSERNL